MWAVYCKALSDIPTIPHFDTLEHYHTVLIKEEMLVM